MQKISRPFQKKAIALAMLVGLVSSCASQETTDQLPELPMSEASLLDDSTLSTPLYDDSSVFADLAADPSEQSSWGASGGTIDIQDSPFYNPIGGESLGRVAYTLYGDRSMVSELRSRNPNLSGVNTLSSGQPVYFDFDRVRPVATHLTKDLLDRYPTELAAKIRNASLPTDRAVLGQGETLQDLSQRLYGTTRYWTEIYLLNQASISNYDRVKAGTELTVYQRPMVGGGFSPPAQQQPAYQPVYEAPAQEPVQPVMPYEETAPVAEAPVNTQPEPAPYAETVPADPIPETPTARDYEMPVAQEDYVPQRPVEPEVSGLAGLFENNSTNVRRILYVGLILLIGALAFYFTRSSKKKTFDMLDVTTNDTSSARQKLGNKDSHHQDIG